MLNLFISVISLGYDNHAGYRIKIKLICRFSLRYELSPSLRKVWQSNTFNYILSTVYSGGSWCVQCTPGVPGVYSALWGFLVHSGGSWCTLRFLVHSGGSWRVQYTLGVPGAIWRFLVHSGCFWCTLGIPGSMWAGFLVSLLWNESKTK